MHARRLPLLAMGLLPLSAAAGPLTLDGDDVCFVRAKAQAAAAADAHTLLIDTGERAYRLLMSDACLAVGDDARVQLGSHAGDGALCGQRGDFVRSAGGDCTVEQVLPMTRQDFARVAEALARGEDRQAATLARLAPITVVGKNGRPKRLWSSEHCFDPDFARGWIVDGDRVIVDSGRRGRHALEFTSSCGELSRVHEIVFQPGIGGGLICGNPGDRIALGNDIEVSNHMERRVDDPWRFLTEPMKADDGFGLGRGLSGRSRCDIARVERIDDATES